jgi:predicted nucleic acid-binding protein
VLVIADSSPLIHLSRVGVLHLLPALFDEIVAPRAVWGEVAERRPSAPGVDALHQARWLRVVDDPPLELDLGLDPGETAAILLAESLRADLLLIDERVGREVAQARGLTVRGTLGVLVQARREGLLPALKPLLDALFAEGFRIAPALVREALAHVGEGSEPAGAKPTDPS